MLHRRSSGVGTTYRILIGTGLAGLLALAVAIPVGAQRAETSRVYASIPDDPLFRVFNTPVPGSSATLRRDSNGIDLAIDSSQLPEGAYTLWLRVFNRPDLCVGGEGVELSRCSRGADIMPAAEPCVPDEEGQSSCSVFWIASFLVGPDGKTHVSARVNKNEWRGFVILGADVAGTAKQAVWNVFGAEYHAVLRFHGAQALPEAPVFRGEAISAQDEADLFRLGRQITRVGGNCEGLPGDADPATCFDAQLAFFPPMR
jgi:hypothetical protein